MPQTQRPSPKRGVVRLLTFFALVAALLYGIDWAVDGGLRRIRTSSFGASNLAMSGRVNAEIVISGSSRALTHYNPQIIQRVTGHSTFNLGRNGSQTDMQLAYLKAYLEHNAKPKLVIHNLDLFSFQTSKEIYDPIQYLPYISNHSIYEGIKRVYPDAWKWRYLPLYGYVVEDMRFTWIKGAARLFGSQPREDYILGFQPRHTPWTGDFEKFKASIPEGIKTEMEPQGIRDLTELIELCRNQDIRLLLVYSPEYFEMQALEKNRLDVFAKFRELTNRFGVGLWDYSDSIIGLDRGNFYNSQHLNAEGADLFSQDLAERLVQAHLGS